jgi:spectinomycin phosphotransferase
MNSNMKVELKINKGNFKKELEDLYNLKITSITFLPEGEDGVLYVVKTENSQKYLAKFIGVRRDATSDELEKQITFSKILKDRGLDFIVAPIASKNNTVFHFFDDKPFALFPFIEGKRMKESGLTDEQIKNIARAFSKLHAVKDWPEDFPQEEIRQNDFDDFEARFRILETYNDKSKYAKQFVELLLPLRNTVLEDVNKFKQYYDTINFENKVISHRDPSPGNIIFNSSGKLFIIDWDSIMLARPENDINLFSNPEYFPQFLKEYTRQTNKKLQFEALAMFRYKWDLESIWERMETILDNDVADIQKKHEIKEMKLELHEYSKIGGILKEIKETILLTS